MLPTSGGPPGGARPRNPSLAVVVAAHEAERHLAATLDSVLDQSVEDWECVVVDDGSTDRTAAVARSYQERDPRFRVVSRPRGGVSAARNAGLRLLSPSVRRVALLDSDDTWLRDALAHLSAALDAHPSAVAAYGYAERMDEDGRPVDLGVHPALQRRRRRLRGARTVSVPPHEPVVFEEWVVTAPVFPPGVALLRREVVEAVGGFDETLSQSEDGDLFTRMSRHGSFVPVDRQVAWYRQHPQQASSRRAEFWYAHDRVRRKTWESSQNTPAQRRAVVRAWRVAQCRRVARCALRLLGALVGRDRRAVLRFAGGLLVLLRQLLAGRPPVARLEDVHRTGRAV